MEQNNQVKQKNIGLRLVVALLLIITTIASCLGIYAWAKYTTSLPGNASAQIAKWHFDLRLKEGKANATETTGPIDLASTQFNHVANGKIAPGTSGKFDVIIDTTGTEVDVNYTVDFSVTNCPRNITFYRGNDATGDVLSAGGKNKTSRTFSFSRYLAVKHDDGNGNITNEAGIPHTETIYWEWPYEKAQGSSVEKFDSWDTTDASLGTTTMTITATGTEVLEEPEDVTSKIETLYAKLLSDGTLVLSSKNDYVPESGVTVVKDYDNANLYNWSNYNGNQRWYSETNSITKVLIADRITPKATARWFAGCSNLTQIENIKNLNTRYDTNMASMFYGCGKLTSLDVSGFDTSNVTTMESMFAGCSNLTSIDVSGFDTSNVTKMNGMFFTCSKLASIDVSGFDTSKVVWLAQMFGSCNGLTTLDLSAFDTENVTNMNSMFEDSNNLTTLNISNFDTSSVEEMSRMFAGCTKLAALDMSKFDTSNVTNMSGMFIGCHVITSLNLESFDTRNVTDISYIFNDCRNLETIIASNKFTISSRANSQYMFGSVHGGQCTKLVGGNGTTFDESHLDYTYARIDTPETPGYFTATQN